MAALTGTQIVALARLYAQDDGTNKGVSDADALLILNDVLLALRDEGEAANAKIVAASTSGLSFAAGETVKTTTSTDLMDIVSFHPSDTSGLPSSALLTPALERVTVEELRSMHEDGGDGVVAQAGTEWEAWAAEPVDGGPPGTWRVLVYPALSVARYAHVYALTYQTLSALSGTPDLDERQSRDVARLCALIWCPLLGRDEAFVRGILQWIPKGILDRVSGTTIAGFNMPSRVREVSS